MSAKAYNCPSCGAPISFTSSIAVSLVCPYCSSLVVRSDLDVKTLGKVAQLPPDLTPLQIGSTGELDGVKFRLAGRVRWQWDGGAWTEWYAEIGGGTGRRWLAETQGFYALSALVPMDASQVPASHTLNAGDNVTLADERFTVVDVKEAACVGLEGELPFAITIGETRWSADLQNASGAFASIEGNGDVYKGRYATFAECRFENLRAVPGWTPGEEGVRISGGTTSFSCANCGAPITIRASGLTLSAVCGSCGSIVDATNPQHAVLQEAKQAIPEDLALPIGTRGTLRGVAYEVIGFVARRDEHSTWEEYLLFNPWRGFDWLVTWNNHWSFIERLLRVPQSDGAIARYNKRTFKRFAAYDSEVVAVLGEFYWRTEVGEKTAVADYVDPPYVMSREMYPGLDEETWSHGEYIPHKEVAKAFNVKLRRPRGIWLNQPNPYRERVRGMGGLAATVMLLMGVMQLWFLAQRPLHLLTEAEWTVQHGEVGRSFTTEAFELTRPSNRVEVAIDAWVNNQWGDFDLALVEETTGARYDQDLEVSYYTGFDSDGAWSEGSPQNSTAFSAVEPGRYRLLVEPSPDPGMSELKFHVNVRECGVFWSAFALAAFMVLVYPVFMGLRGVAFESKRWSDSDSAGSDD